MESQFTIRRIESSEESLFREAYSWSENFPRWYRCLEDLSFEEFLENAQRPEQVDVGIFGNGLAALITLRQVGKGAHEVHILAKRGIDKRLLINACESIREQTKGLVERFTAKIWARNHELLRVARVLGFRVIGKSNRWVEMELRDGIKRGCF